MEPFNPNNEKWENYHERMELVFQANEVKAADYGPTMLAPIGAESYGVLKDLVSPDKPKDKEDIVLARPPSRWQKGLNLAFEISKRMSP